MVEAAQQLNLIPQGDTSVIIFVTIFDEKSQQMSLTIASKLRNAGIATEIFPDVDKLDKQLKYADKKGIPYVLIQGPEEVKRGVVKLKNMATKEQEELTLDAVIEKLTSSS